MQEGSCVGNCVQTLYTSGYYKGGRLQYLHKMFATRILGREDMAVDLTTRKTNNPPDTFIHQSIATTPSQCIHENISVSTMNHKHKHESHQNVKLTRP